MVVLLTGLWRRLDDSRLRAHPIAPNASFSSVTALGYSGLFRLPTSSTLKDGEMNFGFGAGALFLQTKKRSVPPKSSAYSATIGFLPGLEIGLSFLTPSPLNGILADRTVSVKYALPLPQASGYSLAMGSTDVEGTRLRASDYIVGGKRFGPLSLYLGYARGLLARSMGGFSWDLNSRFALIGEQTGSIGVLGVGGQPLKNLRFNVGMDSHQRTVLSTNFSVSLGTTSLYSNAEKSETPEELADSLGRLGLGSAEAKLEGGTLIASYDDVEARSPMETLRLALKECVTSSIGAKELSLTVWRMGLAQFTISGPVASIRSFMQGFSSRADFLHDVRITSGGTYKGDYAGPSPSTLISLAPGISYHLGVQDSLPNREFIQTRTISRLPYGLLGATVSQINVNNNFGRPGNPPPASYGVYKATERGDIAILAGMESSADLGKSGDLQVAYRPVGSPLSLLGGYRHSIENERSRHFVQVGLDVTPSLSLWARNERFQAGDVGSSVGVTRRFGELRVTLEALKSEEVRQVGVLFQLPLRPFSLNLGNVRVATDRYSEFSYRPTIHAESSGGLAVTSVPVLSLADQLQARGDLSAQYVRNAVDKLRDR